MNVTEYKVSIALKVFKRLQALFNDFQFPEKKWHKQVGDKKQYSGDNHHNGNDIFNFNRTYFSYVHLM